MKRIIRVYNEPGGYKLLPAARDSMRAAAKRWGAEFRGCRRISKGSGYWADKARWIQRSKEDQLLFMDGDMLIRHDCPNPFEIVPPGYMGVVSVVQDHRIPLSRTGHPFPMFNGGFQLVAPAKMQPFCDHFLKIVKQYRGYDQPALRECLMKFRLPCVWLPSAFNFLLFPDNSKSWLYRQQAKEIYAAAPRLPAPICHFRGIGKGFITKAQNMARFDWQA